MVHSETSFYNHFAIYFIGVSKLIVETNQRSTQVCIFLNLSSLTGRYHAWFRTPYIVAPELSVIDLSLQGGEILQ